MKRIVVPKPEATQDLGEIARHIAQVSPQSAERFLLAAERTFLLLAGRPGIGALYEREDPRLADVRVSTVTRFRSYLIFYRATDDRLEVLRVLHAARDVDSLLAEALDPG